MRYKQTKIWLFFNSHFKWQWNSEIIIRLFPETVGTCYGRDKFNTYVFLVIGAFDILKKN